MGAWTEESAIFALKRAFSFGHPARYRATGVTLRRALCKLARMHPSLARSVTIWLTSIALVFSVAGCCAGLASMAAPENFAGKYSTNWGICTFNQTGNSVAGSCARGTAMACTATGKVLMCDWKEATGLGKAVLAKQADGSLTGTWGKGPSTNNGGPWTFAPQK